MARVSQTEKKVTNKFQDTNIRKRIETNTNVIPHRHIERQHIQLTTSKTPYLPLHFEVWNAQQNADHFLIALMRELSHTEISNLRNRQRVQTQARATSHESTKHMYIIWIAKRHLQQWHSFQVVALCVRECVQLRVRVGTARNQKTRKLRVALRKYVAERPTDRYAMKTSSRH